MPMCGIVTGRGWQIISVALEPRCSGDFCETWDILINKVQMVSEIVFEGIEGILKDYQTRKYGWNCSN